MNVFLLLNLIRLELRSASESVQPVKIIWVGLKSNKVRLTKSSASEPGLKWSCFVQKSLHNNNETFFLLLFAMYEDNENWGSQLASFHVLKVLLCLLSLRVALRAP